MTRMSWDWQKNRKVHNKENIENFTWCIDYFCQDMKNWLSLGQGTEELEDSGDRATYFPL